VTAPLNPKTALVVLSSKAQLFDMPSLKNLVMHAHPGCAVFFVSTSGDPMGVEAPDHVDLLIDFTPPGARQPWWFATRMRSRAEFAVGRKAGWWVRQSKYDQVFDEKVDSERPRDFLDAERWAQRGVLQLAGVPVVKQGGVTVDRSKDIALDLPPMQRG
jgi:hypothetical protein